VTPTALTGATLIDVDRGVALPDSTVVIEDGRIARVGAADATAIPPDTRTVDVRGKWIIPGLIDMHVHLSVYRYRLTDLYLDHGVTTVRDVAGDVTLLRLLRDDIESGEVSGPRLFFTGNLLDGAPPVFRTSFVLLADTPERAGSIVDFLADQGVHAIKAYNMLSESTLAAIIAAAARRGLPVIGHIPRAITMTRAVEMGMEGLEHIRITARELLPVEEAEAIDYLPVGVREPKLWDRIDLDGTPMSRLIGLLARSGIYLDPTLIMDEVIYVDGVRTMKAHPDNRLLPPEILEELLKEPDMDILDVPEELRGTALEAFRKRVRFVGMCHRAGVRVIAGTDAWGLGKLIAGLSLHRELELLCEAGLTPLEALQAATITAARALRSDSEIGSIRPGKRADLVILDADPLASISNTRRINRTIKGGEMHSPAGAAR